MLDPQAIERIHRRIALAELGVCQDLVVALARRVLGDFGQPREQIKPMPTFGETRQFAFGRRTCRDGLTNAMAHQGQDA